MARFLLSRVLLRDRFPLHRLIAIRGRSRARIVEDDEAGEVEVSLRRLEDAVHAISVLRAAPDWLPFVPGSSYWMPPPRRVGGVADAVRKLAIPLTEEEAMSLTTIRGWPSSAYFVEGDGSVVCFSYRDHLASGGSVWRMNFRNLIDNKDLLIHSASNNC